MSDQQLGGSEARGVNDTVRSIRESPIEPLLEAYGFRPKLHGWTCPFHDDKRPSAKIWRNRLKCWVCTRSWSNIDLSMKLEGIALGQAVKRLGAFYCIPMEQLTPQDRTRYLQAKAGAPALAQRMADFAHGLLVFSDCRLAAVHAMGIDAEAVSDWHQQAYILAIATPAQIAQLWAVCPELRDAVEALGRRERVEAEQLTNGVVDVLAATQERKTAA